ncbi:hypothetical protein SAMN05421505_10431 [Sinosporangium album]|uniref:Lipoprotein n=1 Tax=Sinosporangium album TaxID=504805 RepID=A0A1G7TZP7_9ACTN|nr:hypothetical protein [Sinosporangium album]SDG40753.1 hypothetical protein SAMN05421505_10431 [Sinosporangium album]
MPRSIPVRLGAILLAGGLTLTACGADDPTSATAGTALKDQVMTLLKERGALNVKVTDPGGKDIPCGDDRAKQTFSATGEDASSRQSPGMLNELLLGSMSRVAPHRTTKWNRVSSDLIYISVAIDPTKTTLKFDSSTPGRYVVNGETECLTPAPDL